MIWTYTASEITSYQPTPDAYFAQVLLRAKPSDTRPQHLRMVRCHHLSLLLLLPPVQHLYVKAFPFAPALGNDHSIQPSMDANRTVAALYSAWAPLFMALQVRLRSGLRGPS
jgi:hypothetical protein